MLKVISKEDRSDLRKAGIKIGRYHVFLPRMLKPSAVDLRVKLWKLYYPEDKKYLIPKSGLNFLKDEKISSNKFLLISTIKLSSIFDNLAVYGLDCSIFS